MMWVLQEAFKQLNVLLPDGEKVVSYSVLPLPYEGYYECYVESDSKKRYRALISGEKFLSPLTEWELPGGIKNAQKC